MTRAKVNAILARILFVETLALAAMYGWWLGGHLL
jgi:hypothetical protein